MRPRTRLLLPLAVTAIAVVGLLIVVGREAHHYVGAMERWVASLGFWGPAVFTLLFVLLTSVFVPDSLLSIIAGAAFGGPVGLGVVLVGGGLASALQYGLGRSVLRRRVERLVEARPKLARIDRALRGRQVRLQLLLRLTPMSPTLGSYLFGAAGVGFGGFAVALVGLVPAYALQVWMGAAGSHVAEMTGRTHGRVLVHDVLVLGGLLTCLVVLVVVTRTATRAIDRAAGPGD